MTGAEVLDVARDALWVLVVVTAPPTIAALVIGLIISLVQALTQIQEMTLTFVPKLVGIFAVILISLPFVGQAMGGLMARLAERIISG